MVKAYSSTIELPLILIFLSVDEVGGICHVAVKCIDMTWNTNCEGSSLNYLLTLMNESMGSEQD